MMNVKRDENSPVEIIYERLKRFHTNETDGRERESDSGKKRVGGRENKINMEGVNDEYLEEKNTG